MTDDDVTAVTIRVEGGPMPGGMLDQLMREQGVWVVHRSDRTAKRWENIVELTGAIADITVLVVQGGRPAIRAALSTFRKRFPDVKVEVQDGGEPDDGGFLDD